MLTTYANLLRQLTIRRRYDRIARPIRYNLTAQMRAANVTIRELAVAMDIPQTRIRVTRSMDLVDYARALDYQKAIEKIVKERTLNAAVAQLPQSWKRHVWATEANFAEAARLLGRAS
jgi:hypothetical protein